MNQSFIAFNWKNGLLYEHGNHTTAYHTRLHALVGENTFHFNPGSSYYIFVAAGVAYIKSAFPLLPNYYASCTARDEYITGNEQAMVVIIEAVGSLIPFLLGGPLEETGRLKYIDGCTDSLLIAPWLKGEPCLNHLHFPAGIDQTAHTHPTIRIGIIVKGQGECVTPFGNIPLQPGTLFAILPHVDVPETAYPIPGPILTTLGLDGKHYPIGMHAFRTWHSTMDVVAFHPDSDFGPEHDNHPMINRTIVNGHSAANIKEIRTK